MGKGFKIARVGDRCTHGAVIITGDPIRIVEGQRVARLGDLVACPIHGINPLVTVLASPVVTTEKKTARIGSVAQCGAVVITGSNITFIDRSGD